jgi:calcium homeostasis ER protein
MYFQNQSSSSNNSNNGSIQQQQPPPPPDDPEQKNIIDKLANFVARNGPEFENVTRLKQKDNPRFRFLFNGEYNNYYNYRLSFERELCKLFI